MASYSKLLANPWPGDYLRCRTEHIAFAPLEGMLDSWPSVPLFLLIDPAQGLAILHSRPSRKGYQNRVEVALGVPLDLPEPWQLTIDTGKLIETKTVEGGSE